MFAFDTRKLEKKLTKPDDCGMVIDELLRGVRWDMLVFLDNILKSW
jgi:hypothetical protein